MTPRIFALDDGGRILVAADQSSFRPREGERVSTVPANLAMFRIRDGGKLEFVRKYDVETAGARTLFRMGLVPLP
jgi:6-phosphogluconolactonase (cycloisomerase 2 family)